MWFIGVEVEQETSAPPPKKYPRSAPDFIQRVVENIERRKTVLVSLQIRLESCENDKLKTNSQEMIWS